MVHGQVQVGGGGNKYAPSVCKDAEFDKKTKKDLVNLLEKFYDKKQLSFRRLSPKEIKPIHEQSTADEIFRLNVEKNVEKFPISWQLLLALSEQPVVLDAYPKRSLEKIDAHLKKMRLLINKDWNLGDCVVLYELGLLPKIAIDEKIENSNKENINKIIIYLEESLQK
jgi:hypothetical protein